MALTTLRYDYNATLVETLSELDPVAMRVVLEAARERLRDSFADLEHDITGLDFELEVEARYVGQFHELSIPVQELDLLAPENGRLLESFHAAHTEAYGFAQRGSPVEIVHLRVTAVGVLEGQTGRTDDGATPMSFVPTARRQIWLDGATDWRTAESYVLADRIHPSLHRVQGPALFDLATSTLLVPAGWVCSITNAGDLLLARRAPPTH